MSPLTAVVRGVIYSFTYLANVNAVVKIQLLHISALAFDIHLNFIADGIFVPNSWVLGYGGRHRKEGGQQQRKLHSQQIVSLCLERDPAGDLWYRFYAKNYVSFLTNEPQDSYRRTPRGVLRFGTNRVARLID